MVSPSGRCWPLKGLQARSSMGSGDGRAQVPWETALLTGGSVHPTPDQQQTPPRWAWRNLSGETPSGAGPLSRVSQASELVVGVGVGGWGTGGENMTARCGGILLGFCLPTSRPADLRLRARWPLCPRTWSQGPRRPGQPRNKPLVLVTNGRADDRPLTATQAQRSACHVKGRGSSRLGVGVRAGRGLPRGARVLNPVLTGPSGTGAASCQNRPAASAEDAAFQFN